MLTAAWYQLGSAIYTSSSSCMSIFRPAIPISHQRRGNTRKYQDSKAGAGVISSTVNYNTPHLYLTVTRSHELIRRRANQCLKQRRAITIRRRILGSCRWRNFKRGTLPLSFLVSRYYMNSCVDFQVSHLIFTWALSKYWQGLRY